MSFTSFFDFVSKAADVAESVMGVVSTVQQADATKELAKAQEAEILRQQQQAEIEARRETRIAQATLLAQQGSAGATTSTATLGTVGLATQLSSGLTELQSAVDYNLDTLDIKTDSQVSSLYGQAIGQGLSAAASSYEFSKLLFDDGVDTAGEVNIIDQMLQPGAD